MITILATYKLKKSTSLKEFIKYSNTQDQPLFNSFNEVKDFSVYIVSGPNKDIDIFEIINVESWKIWEKLCETEKAKNNSEIWKTLCDEDSLKICYGEKL